VSDSILPIASSSTATRGAEASAPAGGRDRERLELQRVAQQFEAMLLTQMLQEMRKASEWAGDDGSEDGGLGLGNQTFTETIDSELALHLTKQGGLGLTAQFLQAFDRMSGVAGAAPGGSALASTSTPADHAHGGATDGVGVDGQTVTSGFGWRSDPFTGAQRFHKGIDLRAAYGQEVQAAAPGRVVFSGEQGAYGTTVVIEHADGTRSRYAHLSAATVESGRAVAAGEAVGRAGHSGRATGTHVHFEVTGPDGRPTSPGEWLKAL